MIDKEKFRALMEQFGIPFTESEDGSRLFIEVDEETHNPIDGYSGFWCSYEFTPEGEFVKMFIGE